MGEPVSLLGQARAFARDYPRDQMARPYLWDVVDFVPSVIDAGLTGRGGWRWGTPALGGDVESGVLATYAAGDQLLFQTSAGHLIQCDPSNPAGPIVSDRGAVYRAKQNPFQRFEDVIHLDATAGGAPQIVRSGSVGTAPGPAPSASVGTIWIGNAGGVYVVVAGADEKIWFSHPTNDLMTAGGWDSASWQQTSQKVTALAVIRSVLLVFHAASTERVRGSIPPSGAGTNDDLLVEPLFARAGCPDPKAIAYWNENVVFADEHGVHITDGAVIRNLASQGGILSYWRPLWGNRASIAACTFLDYYIITIRQTGALPSVTLICDLNARQWFRFSNINALAYVASGGGIGMERVWAGIATTQRAARIGPCFFPTPGGQELDDDGTAVLPEFETPWYRLAREGRKRVRFVYLSYDARTSGGLGTKQDEPVNGAPPPAPPAVLAALAPVLELSYIRSPQQTTYNVVGQLPETTEYRRFRLPVNQFPYGVAFRVRQTQATSVTRVFDLGVEAQGAERSRA